MCLKALFDFAGQDATQRLAQQDVSEFNGQIWEALEVAFNVAVAAGTVTSLPVARVPARPWTADTPTPSPSSTSSISTSLSSETGQPPPPPPLLAPPGTQWMKQQFYCTFEAIAHAREEDGSPVTSKTTDTTGQIILGVASGSLYRAMDEFLVSTMEYKTPRNFRTTATKRNWVSRVPTVVAFQLQRVMYDAVAKQPG